MRKLALTLLALASLPAALVITSGAAQADEYTTPSINEFGASPSTFYPTVRDGYRDGVGFTFSANPIDSDGEYDSYFTAEQHWSIVVRNSSGNKVASHTGSGRGNYEDADEYDLTGSWNWNGRNLSGVPVHAGTFTANLTVTNEQTGEHDIATRTITARRAYVTTQHTVRKSGSAATSVSHSSDCYADRDYYDHTLDLDCWGGASAVARYSFAIPGNARNVTFNVVGERGCCADGRVIKAAVRRTSTNELVTVKVTNWAEFDIERVAVHYTTTRLR